MNRIDRIFRDLRSAGGKALMPFLTVGDPSVQATAAMLGAVETAGGHVVELGIPFSDPIADGPVIQASMTRALEGGAKVARIMDMLRQQRQAGLSLGAVAMVSYSIVHRLGPAAFIEQAREAGFDGFILPDVPLEESDEVRRRVVDAGMILSLLIAPTTPLDRARKIAEASSGFIYLMSRAGITGEQAALPEDLPHRVTALREVTDLPIAVGFGISTAGQVRQVVEVADAAIVGSAIMRQVAEHRDESVDALAGHVGRFVRDLAGGLPSPAATKS